MKRRLARRARGVGRWGLEIYAWHLIDKLHKYLWQCMANRYIMQIYDIRVNAHSQGTLEIYAVKPFSS